jgi:phosphotransferase system enzyme I (PtsI)
MQSNLGIAVSPGVAIGPALVLDSEGFRIPRRFTTPGKADEEIGRLLRALDDAGAEVGRDEKLIHEKLGDRYAAIFGAHLQIIRDAKLRQELEELIRQKNYSAEYAVSRALRRYAKALQSLGRRAARRAGPPHIAGARAGP